ncbi:MAG: hypothetical protein JJE50_08505 [Actinomycetales bacterium]|nr:hypothetical protein [Actinomycetales bacterium]
MTGWTGNRKVSAVDAVAKPLVGQDARIVRAALEAASLGAPDPVLESLAARIGAMPAWAFVPPGTVVHDETTGGTFTITNQSQGRVAMRRPEQ